MGKVLLILLGVRANGIDWHIRWTGMSPGSFAVCLLLVYKCGWYECKPQNAQSGYLARLTIPYVILRHNASGSHYPSIYQRY